MEIVLTASRYGSGFAAGHDCEMRPDRHCMCKGGFAISALSARAAQWRREQTSWRWELLLCNEGGVNSMVGWEG